MLFRRRVWAVLSLLSFMCGLLVIVAPAKAEPADRAGVVTQQVAAGADRIARRFVRAVNRGRRHAARRHGTRSAVRTAMEARNDGSRFRGPDPCYETGGEKQCPFSHYRDGQLVGSAWFTVDRRDSRLKVTQAAIAFGERAAYPVTGSPAAKVVYSGRGIAVWRASGQMHRLSDTSRAFRRFVGLQHDEMWGYLDNDPDCAQAPLVTVKEYRRRVAFISNQGTFPGGPGDAPGRCAGGGAFRFYVKRDGTWRAPVAIGGHETLRCRTLQRWDIPRMNGAKRCWNGTDIVRYDP